jgi:hypothetical protein
MGAGGAGPGGAGSLRTLGELGAGKTSSTLIPGGTLVSQMMRPRTTTWNESDPDMQTPSFRAGASLPVAAGKGSRGAGEPGRGVGRAGHGGEAGSLMSPFLPRGPPFAYGLLRMSESPPAGVRGPAARSIEAAGAELPTEEPSEAPGAAGGAARSTSTAGSGLAVGRDSSAVDSPAASGGAPTATIGSAGRGPPHPAPTPPPIATAPARRDARRRPLTAPV